MKNRKFDCSFGEGTKIWFLLTYILSANCRYCQPKIKVPQLGSARLEPENSCSDSSLDYLWMSTFDFRKAISIWVIIQKGALLVLAPKILLNSTEGAHDFGDHCKYDSELSGNRKRVQSRGSNLNPNPRTNKQTNNMKSKSSDVQRNENSAKEPVVFC